MIGSQPYSFSMNPTTHFLHHKIFPSQPVYTTTYPIKTRKTIIKQLFKTLLPLKFTFYVFLHFLVIFHKQKFLFLSFFSIFARK